MITKRDYQDAITIQDACNLSGVVRTWGEILSRMTDLDTKEKCNHPINVLFASKVSSLTGSDLFERFSEAYKACKEKAE